MSGGATKPPAAGTRGTDVALGLALTLVLVVFHFVLMQHAGGLWRDEVNSVNLSTPGLTGLLEFNGNDSFPVLWFVILRAFIASGLGDSDLGLRALGFVVGLGMLGALWQAGRKMGRSVPLVAIVLFAFNSENIRWGDSLRAYGLGICLLLATMWLVWQLVREPTRRHFVLTATVSVLSVQCVFYNSFLLLAVALGGAAVAARHRQWKTGLLVLAVGIPAALSLLPYVPMMMRMHEWSVLVKTPFTAQMLWHKVAVVLGAPGVFMIWVWATLCGLAILIAVLVQFRKLVVRIPAERRDLALYCLVSLAVGVGAYVLFLKKLSYPTEPWYYIALTAFAAVCIDGILSILAFHKVFTYLRLSFVGLVAIFAFSTTWHALLPPQTRVDIIAEALTAQANPGDLILVAPWNCGITFNRYYRGTAEWMTVPPIEFHTYHRYDLIKPLMFSTNTMDPVLERMSRTLQKGNRVWVVGRVPLDGTPPWNLPPPPLEHTGWHEGVYDMDWARKAGQFLYRHATVATPMVFTEQAQGYENPSCVVVSGWQQTGK